MRTLYAALCLAIIVSNTATGYTIPAAAHIVAQEEGNAHWDYLGRSFDALRTQQYGHTAGGTLHKRFYKTPAIHKYHGAGSVSQPVFFALPAAAYVNLPPEIKAVVPQADNIDIFFLVTLVQDWFETDEAGEAGHGPARSLSMKPQHWNDPDAPHSADAYHRDFADNMGIFLPNPAVLRLNGHVNQLYATAGICTHGPGEIISSSDSDHLVGGYSYNPGDDTRDLNLCFWGVVQGPTPTGPRTAITLHWVIGDNNKAIRSLHNGTNIKSWMEHADILGMDFYCARHLRTLLGLDRPERTRADGISTAGGSAGSHTSPHFATGARERRPMSAATEYGHNSHDKKDMIVRDLQDSGLDVASLSGMAHDLFPDILESSVTAQANALESLGINKQAAKIISLHKTTPREILETILNHIPPQS